MPAARAICLGRGAVVALDGELVRGGVEDGLAPLFSGLPGGGTMDSEYSLT